MLLVIPVSQSDIDIAVELSQWINILGGIRTHSVLSVFPPNLNTNKKDIIIQNLNQSTDKYYQFDMLSCNEAGWPISSNDMFKQTCEYIINNNFHEKAWYWFEADNTPLKKNWLDTLEVDYYIKNKNFYGRVFNHHYENGEIECLMMAGTGIYPINIKKYLPSYKTINRLEFDRHIRYDINKSLYNSPLIHWTWCSYEYRCINGCIFKGIPKNIRNVVSNAITQPEADQLSLLSVVSHGCKDASLIRCLRENDLFGNF